MYRNCKCKCNNYNDNYDSNYCDCNNNYDNNCDCYNKYYNNYDNNCVEEACENIEPYGDYCNDYNKNVCGFNEEYSVFPQNYMFGQSYVPFQRMEETFTPEVALRKGTIFPELATSYYPNQDVEEIAYIEATNKYQKGCNR